jgi:hypothetical protein
LLGVNWPKATPYAWNRRLRGRATQPPSADRYRSPKRTATNRVVAERIRTNQDQQADVRRSLAEQRRATRFRATARRRPANETLSNPVAGRPAEGCDTPNMRDGKDYQPGSWGFSEETTLAPITG